MTQRAVNYAKVLFDLKISEECVKNSKEILSVNKELMEALSNPTIKKEEKEAVINAVFDQEIRNFLKLLCNNNCIDSINEIYEAYWSILMNSKDLVEATLTYVSKPNEAQIEDIKKFVCRKYNKSGVVLDFKEDSSLLGGFVLTVGDTMFDKSLKGSLSELQKTLVWR
jgi:ATP synthase, F1 delta subunit